MNTLTEPDRRGPYDEAFRREALRLWKSGGRSARVIARELGISAASLYSWAQAEHGEHEPTEATPAAKLVRELRAEVARLHSENDKLRLQREILKKTLAILSEPLKSAPLPPA
ncbi:MAG: transposase [Opitutaceae bacterium]